MVGYELRGGNEMEKIKSIFKGKHFTMIPTTFIKDTENSECILNSKQLSIAMAIYMTRSSKDVCNFNVNLLCDILGLSYNTRIKKLVIDTLQLLEEEKQIYIRNSIYCDDNYHIQEFNKIKVNDNLFGELVHHMDGNFSMFCDLDIQKLSDYSKTHAIDIYSIIKQYLYICSCVNNNDKDEDYLCAFPQLDSISSVCSIKSKNTIVKYNEILKELKILSFDYAGYKIDRNGAETIRNGKMFYTPYGNEEILLRRLQIDREKYGYYNISDKYKELKNLQISISKKITNINKLKDKTIIDIEKLKLLEEEKEKIIQLAEKER